MRAIIITMLSLSATACHPIDASRPVTAASFGTDCMGTERELSIRAGDRQITTRAIGTSTSHGGNVMIYRVHTDAWLSEADLVPGSEVREFAKHVFEQVASDADRCGVRSAEVEVTTTSSCCEYDEITVHFTRGVKGWDAEATPSFHHRGR